MTNDQSTNTQSTNPPLRFFTARDAVPGALAGERVAVLGYGNLGRAFALNLRDAGVAPLTVGNIADEYANLARAEGFSVLPIAEAAASADIALVLLPDEVIPEVFTADIAPNLRPGAAILFASGYNLAYGLVEPPAGIDVLLLAPRMGGEHIRQRFLASQGYVAYVSVEQDASGQALRRLLGIAQAVGVLQTGAFELDARCEADLDLLVEQTLGAAVGVAVMSTFTLGVEAGLPPEALVLEMYLSGEMETVFQAFRQRGFYRSSDFHGPTALYGGFLRTMQLLMSDLPAKFRETLEEIQSGTFARQFQAEREAGYPTLSQAQAMTAEESPSTRPLVEAERRVREMLGIA
jgi:ketol-acid reductoisomerase